MTPSETKTKIHVLLKEVQQAFSRMEAAQSTLNEKVGKLGDLLGTSKKTFNDVKSLAHEKLGQIHAEEMDNGYG